MTTVEDLVGSGSGPGDEAVGDLRDRPALRTLLIDQAKLLDADVGGGDFGYDLRGGFPDRRSVIQWYQRASVRTVGHIADEWDPADCVYDETLLAALVVDDNARVEPMETWKAKKYRMHLESAILQPACTAAYTTLRREAVEYIKSESDSGDEWTERELDPSSQSSIAMRPGFRSLDEQQAAALDELWGGFVSDDTLLNWLHSLNSPTNGEIPDNFPSEVVADDVAMEYLVHDRHTADAEVYRELLAATRILPAFVAGVRSIDASELAKATSDGPTTLRDTNESG